MVPVLSRELLWGRTLEVAPWMPESDDAVDGRLLAFGGWGNEAILIVRRKDLSGLPGVRPPDADRVKFRLEVELEVDSGDLRDGLGLDGVRSLEVW